MTGEKHRLVQQVLMLDLGHAATPPPREAKEPDAHGQAALLLAESMLHVLLEAGVLTRAQAIDALETATEVKKEIAEETGEPKTIMRESLRLLRRIEYSLGNVDNDA